jgi:drug/metabolite transporter (DMT)-like permease
MSTLPGEMARLRPFVCVGLAYFLIGVIVPSVWLHMRGEAGDWTFRGIVWSLAGGALGALGALGIILAFTFGGLPVYVMPIVFGGAPVINAFLTIYLAGRVKEVGPLFLAGLVIVILGAVVVLLFAPKHQSHAPVETAAVAKAAPADAGAPETTQKQLGAFWSWTLRIAFIALAVLCWGAYGPVLHKGQAAMHHSRMRPLVCVGLAYFAIAVVLPYFFLGEIGENSSYLRFGTLMALLAGAFGAAGALGIIMAFNAGGKPVFVMPLVFGGAPVVSTFVTILAGHEWSNIRPFFWAGLILVVAGSVMVLVLAPRGESSQESRVKRQEAEATPA